MEDRLLFLSTVFAIDVCAYAVISKHTPLVLHVNQGKAQVWSDKEFLFRWHKLRKGTLLSQNVMNKHAASLNQSEFNHRRLSSTIHWCQLIKAS